MERLRFVHSLGVYHLGEIASTQIVKSLSEGEYSSLDCDWDKMKYIFLLACLLHDVGHAPFSHTGEVFYKLHSKKGDMGNKNDEKDEDEIGTQELHERLSCLVDSDEFKKDIPIDSKSTAPHEIMSAIIGIKEFKKYIGANSDCEFFARCITGYRYKTKTTENCIRNCFISMLNSKVIDVDRLDYLIRDAYTSGYKTISIDYYRLLKSLSVSNYLDKPYLVYRKDAVSVLENVVYAHDSEKKWIQNHPIVVYEAYIITHMLDFLEQNLKTKNSRLFSEKSLGVEGSILANETHVSLLCDDDVIYLSKNIYSDDLSDEFFSRNKRRHPVWKSEAEYRNFIVEGTKDSELKSLTECIKSLVGHVDFPNPVRITPELVEKFEKELTKSEAYEDSMVIAQKRKISVCKYLCNYADNHGFPCDYIFLPANIFLSNFSKDDLGKTLIYFGESETTELRNVCSILSSKESEKPLELYYLYYRKGRKSGDYTGQIDDIKEFCDGLKTALKC